jgi:hypothetical protein
MLLYIGLNNGSDIRIRKELSSLSKKSLSIVFMGTTPVPPDFVIPNIIYTGSGVPYRSVFGFCLFIAKAYWLIFSSNFSSIHVVDEQLYFFLWPILFFLRLFRPRTKIVLDVFDSIFLKFNIFPSSLPLALLKILYLPASSVIVTDAARLSLYPYKKLINHSFLVVPNVPETIPKGISYLSPNGKLLTIAYIGSLNCGRGSLFLEKLLRMDTRINVLSAGIVTDAYTHKLIDSYSGRWLHHDYLPSQQLQHIVSANAHYILLRYPPTSINNIFASPNKLWDAYALIKPVLVNSSTLVSTRVADKRIGIVYDEYLEQIPFDFVEKLFINYDSYLFHLIEGRDSLEIWSNYDHLLCSAHLDMSIDSHG